MDRNKQESILKDLKTALKFVRIAKTMLENIKNDIVEDGCTHQIGNYIITENDKPILVSHLDNYIQALNHMSEGWDDFLVDEFKYEQKIPGCQLKLF